MREQTNYRATGLSEVLVSEGRKARWLAEQLGVSESHLSRVVNRERKTTGLLAKKVADILNRPLFLLFELTEESELETSERAA